MKYKIKPPQAKHPSFFQNSFGWIKGRANLPGKDTQADDSWPVWKKQGQPDRIMFPEIRRALRLPPFNH